MLSVKELQAKKNRDKITMLTCYDASTASILEKCNVDMILVGDSCANVFLGVDSTKEISIDRIAYHVEAVRNGAPNTHIIADLDYTSSQNSNLALESAKLLIDSGANSVKIEGYDEDIFKILIENEIPIVGHVGLLPQTAKKFRVYGRETKEAFSIIDVCKTIEKAGAFLIVAESIPTNLARNLTEILTVPLIGIGAGNMVDGQVLVINDLLGITKRTPKFVKRYNELGDEIEKSVNLYVDDVKKGRFPDESNSYR